MTPLQEARRTLLRSARHFVLVAGWSQYEWEGDDEVVKLAREHGIENEITHIASLAGAGFRAS